MYGFEKALYTQVLMQTSNQIIGRIAERLVCNHLQQHGLKFIASNYQCKCGEVDLIMRDGEIIVFVEVRHRKISDYGDGVATVTKKKQHKIIKAAAYYLQKNNLLNTIACRFDIVATSGKSDSEVEWIKDAFWEKW